MTDLYDAVLEVLKNDERFFTDDGTFLRNTVYEASMKMDEYLLKSLYNNDITRKKFFSVVCDITIFDKIEFGWLVNNREFLPNSYTRYKNKIGLIGSNGHFISSSNDVELVFPYKDCVLEGGQTKEEQKRDEIFYNETLSTVDIDRLLHPKVFTNAKRYSIDGVEEVDYFDNDDNLIIKGNNLLVLSSLLKKYEGKIKCIYIDPPYNTGKKNSFGYNDSFNHSSWLTFMKNRIEIAKKLLTDDGCILIQTDDKEQAYLKVLCDNIFGLEQFETSFFVQVRYTNKTLAEDSALHKVVETVHVYSKNHSIFSINKIKKEYAIDKFCWKITETGKFDTINVGGKIVDVFKDGTYEMEKVEPGYDNLKETWATGSLIRQGGTAAEFLSKHLIDRKKEDGLKVLYKIHNMGEDGLGYRYVLGPQKESAFRGKFYSGIPTSIKKQVIEGTYTKEVPVPNLMYNFMSYESDFGNCRTEGGVDISGGKKPEQLILSFLEYFSNEGDIVLDFFLGSGTTAATALKAKRKFIGIEQMDYGDNDSVVRLQNVINGDKTGISKDMEWEGGGSFVYCELLKLNQKYIEDIINTDSETTLSHIWTEIQSTGFISSFVNPKDIDTNSEDFQSLCFSDKKKIMVELLDKNQLYVNYCDLDDDEFSVSKNDKDFSRSFYKEV